MYFSPPLPLRSVHVGVLWERWREAFPRSEDQPPVPPVIPESFPASPLLASVQLGVPAWTRTWFLTESGDRVIQIQPDRLVLNWRKTDASQEYPRYRQLKPEFERLVRDLIQFAAEHEYGSVKIGQAEVTYINPVPLTAIHPGATPADLLAPWTGRFSDDFLPSPEDTGVRARFVVTHPDDGKPVGRLYAQLDRMLHSPFGTAPAEDAAVLQVFARGTPTSADVDGAFAFLDLAHRWVVRGFRSLTTTSMHAEWGLAPE